MNHSEFLARVDAIQRELEQLINEAHDTSPPTVEWVAMLSWASCARGSLMGLAELGIPDSSTPLAHHECLLCTQPRQSGSKFCERHAGGFLPPEEPT